MSFAGTRLRSVVARRLHHLRLTLAFTCSSSQSSTSAQTHGPLLGARSTVGPARHFPDCLTNDRCPQVAPTGQEAVLGDPDTKSDAAVRPAALEVQGQLGLLDWNWCSGQRLRPERGGWEGLALRPSLPSNRAMNGCSSTSSAINQARSSIRSSLRTPPSAFVITVRSTFRRVASSA